MIMKRCNWHNWNIYWGVMTREGFFIIVNCITILREIHSLIRAWEWVNYSYMWLLCEHSNWILKLIPSDKVVWVLFTLSCLWSTMWDLFYLLMHIILNIFGHYKLLYKENDDMQWNRGGNKSLVLISRHNKGHILNYCQIHTETAQI